jgi:hypothetical protein
MNNEKINTAHNLEFRKRMQLHFDLLEQLKVIVSLFNSMKLPALTGKEELVEMIKDVCKFVVNRIVNNSNLMAGNISIRRDKPFDGLVKPNEYNNLFAQVEKFKSVFNNLYYLKHFDLIDNEVVIADSFIKQVKCDSNTYTESEAEKRVLQFANRIIAMGDEIFGEGRIPIEHIQYFFAYDVNTNKWDVSEYGIKYNGYVRSEKDKAKSATNNLNE